jgi:hypothetical protein
MCIYKIRCNYSVRSLLANRQKAYRQLGPSNPSQCCSSLPFYTHYRVWPRWKDRWCFRLNKRSRFVSILALGARIAKACRQLGSVRTSCRSLLSSILRRYQQPFLPQTWLESSNPVTIKAHRAPPSKALFPLSLQQRMPNRKQRRRAQQKCCIKVLLN